MINFTKEGYLTVEGQMRAFLSVDKLKSLSTPRILAYKNKFMRGSPFEADMHQHCGQSCDSWVYIQAFYAHLEQIKAILADRPHVDRPGKTPRKKK